MTESDMPNFEGPFRLDDWYVDPAAGRISRQGAEVRLEPKVMALLVLLAKHAGEVMSREAIEAEIWKDVVVGYDALASTVIKLRKALGDSSRQPRYIETVSKKGYRLIAPVRDTHSAETQGVPSAPFRESRKYKLPALAATGVLVLLFVLIAFLKHDEPHQPEQPPPAQQAALMVLPFTNLSDDPQQEYFSDGITQDLIIDLSRYSRLKVISQRTTFSYKTRTIDLKTLSGELGVQYVVEGSIRRDGKHIRVNVQLIDTQSGINLWAERYDRQATGLFDVQDEVRKKIVNALEITLTEEERHREQKRYTNSFEAYDYFLRGQAQLVRRASARDNNLSKEFMQNAIEIDPGFARAHAALALIYADTYRFDWTDRPAQTRQLALKSGQRAIELDPHSPQAYWIMGYIYLFLFEDHSKAIEMSERSLELNPDNSDALTMLAVTHAFGDNPQKARLLMQELMHKNRYYSAMVPSVLGLANLRTGNYAEALSAYNQSLLINPSRIQGNAAKAVVLYRMGNIDDAEFQIAELYNLHPDFDLDVWAARQPFKDKSYIKGMVEDLERAGARK